MARRPARFFALAALALSFLACRDATAPIEDDLTVSSSSDGLVIVNGTGYPIHSIEMESGVLALIDLMPCNRGCSVQLPGERRVVPWTTILGYGSERSDYIVYWFGVETDADGSQHSGPVHVTKLNP